MSEPVQFKKRRRVNNNPRTSTVTVATEDIINEETDAIEDTRILQEERKRRLGGLKRSTVADEHSSLTNTSNASSSSASTVNAAQELANLVTKEGAFTSAFERQTDAPDQASKIEKLMDQYVNEQLAAEKRKWHEQALASAQAKRGAVDDVAKSTVALDNNNSSNSATQDKVAHRGTIEAELYALLPSASSGATVVAGAWAAGIEEVELPLDYKMRNIDETAKATHELAMRRQRQQPAVDNNDRVPKNFSSYSASFSKYHANANNSVLLQGTEQRRTEEQQQQQQQQPQQPRQEQPRQATDFKAMSKFKSHQYRK
jgi:hypothetical protein